MPTLYFSSVSLIYHQPQMQGPRARLPWFSNRLNTFLDSSLSRRPRLPPLSPVSRLFPIPSSNTEIPVPKRSRPPGPSKLLSAVNIHICFSSSISQYTLGSTTSVHSSRNRSSIIFLLAASIRRILRCRCTISVEAGGDFGASLSLA